MARSAALTRFQPDPTDELTLEWVMRQFSRLQNVTQGLDEVKAECEYCIRHYCEIVEVYGLGDGFDLTNNTAYSNLYGSTYDIERVELTFSNLTVDASSTVHFQIGDGSYITTGYRSACGGNSSTSGFVLHSTATIGTSETLDGEVVICKTTDHDWIASGTVYQGTTATSYPISGYLSLTNAYDRARIIVSGTNKFLSGYWKSVYYGRRN